MNKSSRGKIKLNFPVSLVSVHIRRRDYEKYLKTQYNTTFLHLSYFNRARDYIRVKYKKKGLLLFYIVTDDYDWAYQKIFENLNMTDLFLPYPIIFSSDFPYNDFVAGDGKLIGFIGSAGLGWSAIVKSSISQKGAQKSK